MANQDVSSDFSEAVTRDRNNKGVATKKEVVDGLLVQSIDLLKNVLSKCYPEYEAYYDTALTHLRAASRCLGQTDFVSVEIGAKDPATLREAIAAIDFMRETIRNMRSERQDLINANERAYKESQEGIVDTPAVGSAFVGPPPMNSMENKRSAEAQGV